MLLMRRTAASLTIWFAIQLIFDVVGHLVQFGFANEPHDSEKNGTKAPTFEQCFESVNVATGCAGAANDVSP